MTIIRAGLRWPAQAFARGLATKLRPSAPLYLEQGPERTSVAFSGAPGAVPVGSFPSSHFDSFQQAFTTEVDTYEPRPILDEPGVFQDNPQFWRQAQRALAKHVHDDPVYAGLAVGETKSPFFHIYDLRNPPPLGRIPQVEDILGTVRVENGKILVGSFEPNTMYRPVTTYGMMLVSPEMAEKVAEATAQADASGST